jgi:outer membrane lipoprotein SlyB
MAMQPSKAAQPMQSTPRMSDADFGKIVNNIGKNFRRVQVSENNGKETKDIKRVDQAYREFESAIERQSEFMKHASAEQKEVFNEVVQEFTKMRKDGKVDLDKAFREFEAAIARINEVKGDHAAKTSIENIAGIGMKYTDPQSRKNIGKGVIYRELAHRAEKFLAPTKEEAESPLFRKLAGLDKHKDGIVNPFAKAQILGQGEALKKTLADDITGEGENDKSAAQKMAETMGKGKEGGTGGAMPSKIENLHVENLIFKNARVDNSENESKGSRGALPGSASGKSAVPVGHPLLPGPSGSGAAVHAPTPSLSGPTEVPRLEHHQPESLPAPPVTPRLPAPKNHDVEDVEFKETHEPITVKPRNPHAKLKTKETALATAVRGAIDAAPTIAPSAGVVGAVKSVQRDNDATSVGPDPTLRVDDGDEKKSDGDGSGMAGAALTAGAALWEKLKGKKPKGGTEENAKEKGIKEKGAKEGVAEEAKGPKEGLLEEGGKGLAGEAKSGGKLLKAAGKIGKVAGVASLALTAYNSYAEFTDADKDLAAGKITAQQAKEAHAHAVGSGVGTAIGGWVGGALGGIAGTAIAPGVGTLAGGAAGSMAGARAGEWIGEKVGQWWASPSEDTASQVAAHAAAKDAKGNTIIVAPQSAPAAQGVSMPQAVPVSSGPRSRESYFDRQMMNTFVK